MNLLLTGFAPFGDHRQNESWQVAQVLHAQVIGGCKVQALELPCEFNRCVVEMRAEWARIQPAWVVCLGLAASRRSISLERVALNLDDARIPDNTGRQPIDVPIVPDGPPAYFTRLPIKRMAAAVRAHGLPAEVSYSAGTYVCNHLFYGLLHHLPAGVPAGFIHLPAVGTPWPDTNALQEAAPRWTLAHLTQGIRAALEVAVLEGASPRGDQLEVLSGEAQWSEGRLD